MAHEWSRTIDIEEHQTHREQAWKEQVQVVDEWCHAWTRCSVTARWRTVKRKTVRTDKGDGTFTKKSRNARQNIKRSRCKGDGVRIRLSVGVSCVRCRVKEGLQTHGYGLRSSLPAWNVCLRCQREGSRKEQLIVRFKDTTDNAEYTAHCTEQEWLGVKQGARYEALRAYGLHITKLFDP